MRQLAQPFDALRIFLSLQEQRWHHNQPIIRYQHRCYADVYGSCWRAATVLYHEEGWRILFRGLVFSQFLSVSRAMLQFGIYREIRKTLHNSPVREVPRLCDFLTGFLTGASTSVGPKPVDLIRKYLSDDHKNRGYRASSIAHFCAGCSYSARLHAGALSGLKFMFYNQACALAMKYEGVQAHKELKPQKLLLAATSAGIAANVMCCPVELIKRRLEVDAVYTKQDSTIVGCRMARAFGFCKTIFRCVHAVVRTEGPMTLYRGFVPSAMKSVVSTAIQFGLYDLIYTSVNDLFDKES